MRAMFGRFSYCRWIPLLLSVVVLSGCTTVSQTGESMTFKNSIPSILGLLAIAIAFLVFGVGIALESYRKAVPPQRKTKKKRRRSSSGESKAWGGVVIGGGLTLIGLIILLMGVPSQIMAYVTVAPDKVVIRDQLFWFSTSPKEFSYSSVSDISHEEIQQVARRGMRKKEILYITHAGGTERIEMVPIHKAARPHLEQAWRNAQMTGSNIDNRAMASEEVLPDENSFAPVDPNQGLMNANDPNGVDSNRDGPELVSLTGGAPQEYRRREGVLMARRVPGGSAHGLRQRRSPRRCRRLGAPREAGVHEHHRARPDPPGPRWHRLRRAPA